MKAKKLNRIKPNKSPMNLRYRICDLRAPCANGRVRAKAALKRPHSRRCARVWALEDSYATGWSMVLRVGDPRSGSR
jgi:hypothetical protein